MNKELTPLEALEVIKHTTDLYMPNELNGYKRELDIIETALKEKDEAFHEVVKIYQELLAKFTKPLKALEIIKEKVLPLVSLEDESMWKDGIYRVYDNEYYAHTELTKEEFDLLKEVFKNE